MFLYLSPTNLQIQYEFTNSKLTPFDIICEFVKRFVDLYSIIFSSGHCGFGFCPK